MAALAHNVLKMVRKLGYGIGPPGPASPDVANATDEEYCVADAALDVPALFRHFSRLSWLVKGLTPAHR